MPTHGATKAPPQEADTHFHDRLMSEQMGDAGRAAGPIGQASAVRVSVSVDSLTERAYARLRYALIIGQLVPGERTTLAALARQLGTSITPVRNALSRLTATDALYQNRQSGVVVPVLDPAELDELLRLRLAVEGFAFTNAAPQYRVADWRGFKVLHTDVCRAAEGSDPARFAAAVWSLRVVILQLSQSGVLAMLSERIWCRLGPAFTQMASDADRRRQVACNFGRIVSAIGNRDLEEARRDVLDEIVAGTAPRSGTAVDELLAPPLVPTAAMPCRKPGGESDSGAHHV